MAHPSSLDHNTATDAELVAFCEAPDREVVGGTPWVIKLSDHAIVKFGTNVTKEEASNLRRAFELLDVSIVRVPRVYRYFERQKEMEPGYFNGEQLYQGYFRTEGYLVMEYIDGCIASPDQYAALAARVIPILAHFNVICGNIPGPLVTGISRGMFWDDDYPAFGKKQELEYWINKRLLDNELKVSFKHTRLVLCHLDLVPRNILWLTDGSICLLDWASAGFYPRAFEVSMMKLRPSLGKEEDFNKLLLQSMISLNDEEESQVWPVIKAWGNSQRFSFKATSISNRPYAIMPSMRRRKVRDPSWQPSTM